MKTPKGITRDAVSTHSKGSALTEAEILAQIPGARERALEEQKHGFRASDARYSVADKRIVLKLKNGTVIGVPVRMIPALHGATPRQLAAVGVTPTGSALHWYRLDVDLSVPALVREALGAGALQSLFGSVGGKARSSRKAEAARANGAKGGRPRGSGSRKSAGKRSVRKRPERQQIPGKGAIGSDR